MCRICQPRRSLSEGGSPPSRQSNSVERTRLHVGFAETVFPTEDDIDLARGCDIIRLMETATNYRYIVKTEGVRGGNARIEGTRIGVHDVVAYFLLGRDVDGIRAAFPDLSRAQIFECLAYYEDHQAEIERLALPQIDERVK